MGYAVKLTTQAIGQIETMARYISRVLLEPGTARKWAEVLRREIGTLDAMPARYPLTEEEPWRGRGVRKMPVKNVLVYYLIDEQRRTVWVTAVIYGPADQSAALKGMSLADTQR